MENNIRIFAFIDSFSDVAKFETLGFSAEIDDAVNGIFYVEKQTNTSEDAIEIINDCKKEDLDVLVILEKENLDFNSDEYLEYLKGA